MYSKKFQPWMVEKNLKIAKLSKDDECRLCCKEGAIKNPIHFFQECPAFADTRLELFDNSFPTPELGQQSLCQVIELAFVGTVRELIEREQTNSNVCSTELWGLWLEVEQGWGILCVLPVQPKACRTWFKLYYFNPTMASINDTYIVLATIPSVINYAKKGLVLEFKKRKCCPHNLRFQTIQVLHSCYI